MPLQNQEGHFVKGTKDPKCQFRHDFREEFGDYLWIHVWIYLWSPTSDIISGRSSLNLCPKFSPNLSLNLFPKYIFGGGPWNFHPPKYISEINSDMNPEMNSEMIPEFLSEIMSEFGHEFRHQFTDDFRHDFRDTFSHWDLKWNSPVLCLLFKVTSGVCKVHLHIRANLSRTWECIGMFRYFLANVPKMQSYVMSVHGVVEKSTCCILRSNWGHLNSFFNMWPPDNILFRVWVWYDNLSNPGEGSP